MERVPEQESQVIDLEKGSDGVWRMASEQADALADRYIDGLDGYEKMDIDGKIEVLKTLMSELAEDNENRFVVEELARRSLLLEATKVYEETMEGLGVQPGALYDGKA